MADTPKKTDIWMPVYIGSYLADTMHLSAAEHGAYMLLLMHGWRNDGRVPDDDGAMARIAKMTPDEWGKSRAIIRTFFTPKTDPMLGAFLIQNRQMIELEKSHKNKESFHAKAVKGAAARWGNAPSITPSSPQAMLGPMPDPCPSPSPSPSSLPTTKTQPKTNPRPPMLVQEIADVEKPPKAKERPYGFDEFWAAWPSHSRKVNPRLCVEFWQKHKLSDIWQTVVNAVNGFKKTPDWTKDAGQYIPAPLVWLRKEAWTAPLDDAARAAKKAARIAEEKIQDEMCGL